ncbi:unnamed protein product [Gulo gulo]|uniref:Uncharacterized protein n=1 Tax=Gulo gulo TaxID=48420 RepID=A0A9X9LDY9_GULGU|nr:unnamed protein product [Gulo gulo]
MEFLASKEETHTWSEQSQQGGWAELPVSCLVSVGLPPALGDDFLRLGAHVPLHPGAVVDGHVGLAAEVGPQSHMAGCDAGATRGHQWLGQVHLLVLEQTVDLLGALLQALLGQEVREGDVHCAGDVAGFDACSGTAGRWGQGQGCMRDGHCSMRVSQAATALNALYTHCPTQSSPPGNPDTTYRHPQFTDGHAEAWYCARPGWNGDL